MSAPMRLTIEFLSDWHVGEGASALGHIDRMVRRHPEDDLPYVPAKTLTGILRDSCERAAMALDSHQVDGAWQRYVDALFGVQSVGKAAALVGTTSAAKVRIEAARFEPSLRRQLCRSAALRSSLVFVKPGVKLDKNGVAESGMLRLEEMVLAGTILAGEMTLDVADEERPVAEAILQAGARLVERLGAKRRRGHGRCRLHIEGVSADYLKHLETSPPTSVPREPDVEVLRLSGNTAQKLTEQWYIMDIDLRLAAPVQVLQSAQGNVVTSRDYLPGSMLVPALDGWLRQLLERSGGSGQLLTDYLACGQVRVCNGYPLQQGRRLLPVPAALMNEKESSEKFICSFARDPHDDHIQRKQLRQGFVAEDGLLQLAGKPAVVTVRKVALTHAVIDDEAQRPTEAVGGVYTYEAIAPGETFRARILIDRAIIAKAPVLAELPLSVLRLGRAKKDDYGRVEIETLRMAEGPPSLASEQTVDRFSLWLLSPLLLRDPSLSWVTTGQGLCDALSAHLGIPLSVIKSSVRVTREDGWNRAWNEPFVTRFTLAPGSCLLIEAKSPIPLVQLARLEQTGFGERLGEGYGEIKINAPLLGAAVPDVLPCIARQDTEPEGHVELPDSEFTRALVKRAWRMTLRRLALERAPDWVRNELKWELEAESKPGNSQLGALRVLFEQYMGPDDHRRFRAWLEKLKQRDNRKNKWPARTLEVLQCFADQEQDIFDLCLQPAGSAADSPLDSLPTVTGLNMRDEMRFEAARIVWLTAIGWMFDQRAQLDSPESSNQLQQEG